jgi:hypothetical protein
MTTKPSLDRTLSSRGILKHEEVLAMFYEYAELSDGTQVAYSDVLEDGTVEVSVERPVDLGFDSALCSVPSFEWARVDGFSEEEMALLDGFVHRNAPLILRLAREVPRTYA